MGGSCNGTAFANWKERGESNSFIPSFILAFLCGPKKSDRATQDGNLIIQNGIWHCCVEQAVTKS